MVADYLAGPDDEQLAVEEVIRRIAPAFDRVSFERVASAPGTRPRSTSLVRQFLHKSVKGGVLVTVVEGSDSLELAQIEAEGVFTAYVSPVEREHWRPVVARVADLLDYKIYSSSVVLRVTVATANLLLDDERRVYEIVRDCVYNMSLGSIEGYRTSYMGLAVDVFTHDTDAARECLELVLKRLAPGLGLTWDVVA